MISYISGTIQEVDGGTVLIVNNGIGYEVSICGVGLIFEPGNEVSVYVRTFIKDDHMELYGFASKEVLTMFGTLQSVSGIGSKMAAQILNSLSVQEITETVRSGDAGKFQQIPGVGKKVASRLVLELQSTLGETQTLQKLLAKGDKKELVHALKTLGYSTSEVTSMIQDVSATLPLDEQIQQALQSHG